MFENSVTLLAHGLFRNKEQAKIRKSEYWATEFGFFYSMTLLLWDLGWVVGLWDEEILWSGFYSFWECNRLWEDEKVGTEKRKSSEFEVLAVE